MNAVDRDTSAWLERSIIVVFSTAYLIAFNMSVPHGDALRIVRQIEERHLAWNPNHLYLDPIGYAWFALLDKLEIGITPLGSFELISAISAVSALLIFHTLLLETGVTQWRVRALAMLGLFASKTFLTLALSQYYFILQMPFLMWALLLVVRYVVRERSGSVSVGCLYGIGVLSAIASAIMFSNVFLVGSLGVAAGLSGQGRRAWNIANSARVWGAAAAVGVPLFVIGYYTSDSNDAFFRWLSSYQGDSGATTNTLYGIEWTIKGVALSLARAGFTLVPAIAIEMAGMGTAIRAFLSQEPLEFVPEIWKLVLALALTPVVAGTMIVVLGWTLRRLAFDRLAQFAIAWIGAYFTFNVLWSSSEASFWVQCLPVVWLLLLAYLGVARQLSPESSGQRWRESRWIAWTAVAAVAALMLVNTVQGAVPLSWVDVDGRQAQHLAILRDGDLEIVPGWDGYGLMDAAAGPQVERLTLMNMALERPESPRHISRLPSLVADHLASGKRVVVARLYDKDRDVNPWVGLSRMGWSRGRIQGLLSQYCRELIGSVDDVVLRSLTACPQ